MSEEEKPLPSELSLEDVACLTIAITIWLAREDNDILAQIGALADALKEGFDDKD